jgi:uncharacterized protein (TIGR02246 family)
MVVAGVAMLGVAGCANSAPLAVPAVGGTTRCDGSPSALLRSFEDAFNQHDASALAALFSFNATFINIYGQVMEGRSGIERGHQQAFDSRLIVAELLMRDVDEQKLSSDEYLLYGRWTLTQTKTTSDSTSVPEGSGVLTAVAQCGFSQKWELRAATNVREATPPS